MALNPTIQQTIMSVMKCDAPACDNPVCQNSCPTTLGGLCIMHYRAKCGEWGGNDSRTAVIACCINEIITPDISTADAKQIAVVKSPSFIRTSWDDSRPLLPAPPKKPEYRVPLPTFVPAPPKKAEYRVPLPTFVPAPPKKPEYRVPLPTFVPAPPKKAEYRVPLPTFAILAPREKSPPPAVLEALDLTGPTLPVVGPPVPRTQPRDVDSAQNNRMVPQLVDKAVEIIMPAIQREISGKFDEILALLRSVNRHTSLVLTPYILNSIDNTLEKITASNPGSINISSGVAMQSFYTMHYVYISRSIQLNKMIKIGEDLCALQQTSGLDYHNTIRGYIFDIRTVYARQKTIEQIGLDATEKMTSYMRTMFAGSNGNLFRDLVNSNMLIKTELEQNFEHILRLAKGIGLYFLNKKTVENIRKLIEPCTVVRRLLVQSMYENRQILDELQGAYKKFKADESQTPPVTAATTTRRPKRTLAKKKGPAPKRRKLNPRNKKAAE